LAAFACAAADLEEEHLETLQVREEPDFEMARLKYSITGKMEVQWRPDFCRNRSSEMSIRFDHTDLKFLCPSN
jgi:hypothetical protein